MRTRQKVKDYILAHKSEFVGKTVCEVLALIPFKVDKGCVRDVLHTLKIKFITPVRGFHRFFNWDLCNVDLAEAWGGGKGKYAAYRWKHKKPKAKYRANIMSEQRKIALDKEKAKAAFIMANRKVP